MVFQLEKGRVDPIIKMRFMIFDHVAIVIMVSLRLKIQ